MPYLHTAEDSGEVRTETSRREIRSRIIRHAGADTVEMAVAEPPLYPPTGAELAVGARGVWPPRLRGHVPTEVIYVVEPITPAPDVTVTDLLPGMFPAPAREAEPRRHRGVHRAETPPWATRALWAGIGVAANTVLTLTVLFAIGASR